MLTKTDLILLLTDIEANGIDVQEYMKEVLRHPSISKNVLKFINDYRHFEVADFYNMIRVNYNKKKSSLYKNLVKDVFDDPAEILTTLSALNLQIMLYAKKLDDNALFLKHSRGEDITFALNNYYKTFDLIPCMKVLKLIKADLKSFESILR